MVEQGSLKVEGGNNMDEIVVHKCGFKFTKSTLGKTEGKCPKCGEQLILKENLNKLYGA